MESGKKSLEELTTAGVFHVPEYQRYYSWTEPEWDDLWTDLYTLPLDKQHYFGTIIIQKTDETESGGSTGGYDSSREKPINLLIDGQQRLTSLALLVRSMTECLEEIAPETDHEGEILNDVEEMRETLLVEDNIYQLQLLDEVRSSGTPPEHWRRGSSCHPWGRERTSRLTVRRAKFERYGTKRGGFDSESSPERRPR